MRASERTAWAASDLLRLGMAFALAALTPRARPAEPPHQTNVAPAITAGTGETNAVLRKVGEGLFELGLVRLDQNAGALNFPARVNLREGPIEYALVHSIGKIHESLLVTEVPAMQLQVAALLLGWQQPAGTNTATNGPPSLPGQTVRLQVSWKEGTNQTNRALEELVWNTTTQLPMSPGPWVFTGSRVIDGTFLAQRDGSIVTIITDPDALFGNPRPQRDDDEIWRPIADKIPPLETPVTVTITAFK